MSITAWKFRIINWAPVSKRLRLRMQASLVSASYDREILAAQGKKDRDSIASIESEASWALQEYTDAETSLVTHTLRRQASRLGVAEPKLIIVDGDNTDGNWYRSRWTGEWLLTSKGTRILRKRIRAELKARAELRAMNIPWITALVGLIGAAIGIVSLVSKH